jgi:hypothetical protein
MNFVHEMKMIPADQEAPHGDLLKGVLDLIITSRFDLLMLAMGLAIYMILFSSRIHWKESQESKKLKELSKDSHPAATPNHEAVLAKHVANREHAEMQTVVASMPVGSALSFDLVLSVLGFCRISSPHRAIADSLLERITTADIDILSEFIHFYLDSNQFGKACNVFEVNFAVFVDGELGQDTEWSLMLAALECGRHSLASHLFETSQLNVARHVLTIQKWWKHASRPLSCGDMPGEEESWPMQWQDVSGYGDVMGRLAHVFNERFPFVEDNSDSNDESTVFFGDDDDSDTQDSDYDGNNWTVSTSESEWWDGQDSEYDGSN